jgi:hypothetical protein
MAASGATFHSESSIDPDFCGTGASVDELFEDTLAHVSERDGVGKAEHHGSVTFSYGDASVILSFAGQFTDTIVATEAGGVEIHQLISKGITVKIQLANGPVLLIEAGVIVTLVTVQNGNEIDVQIVSMNGPHPLAESGGSLFCEIVPSGARHHLARAASQSGPPAASEPFCVSHRRDPARFLATCTDSRFQ